MIRTILASLMLSIMPTANAVDHLMPLGPGTGVLDQKVDKNWLKIIKNDDVAFVRFDIRPTFEAPSHLAIFGSSDKGPFRVCYLKGSYLKETPSCAPITNDFEKLLADRVESIIRANTHYGVAGSDVQPLDATSYFFAANFVFAEVSGADKGSVPRQLIDVFEECIKLAQMKPDDSNRQTLMDEILKDLDAIKVSSST